jgi:RNA polymerase sigma-70 factor, ECF subfamily
MGLDAPLGRVSGMTPSTMPLPTRPPRVRTTLARAGDDDLVALVRCGHDAAFAELHDRHRSSLERLAGALLRGSPHDPQDVVQDAFLSAYLALRSADRPIALRPWLTAIVRNRAIDCLRRPLDALRAPDADQVLQLLPARHGDPAEVAGVREEVRLTVEAIGRLPERQRFALVRRELEGRGLEEVAAGLGTSVSATWSLLSRARTAVTDGRARGWCAS